MTSTELNLAELLKGCEEEEFWSPIFGKIFLYKIGDYGVEFRNPSNANTIVAFYSNGLYCTDGICQVFPSKELYEKYPLDAYSTWMEWKELRKQKQWNPSLGDEYFSISGCAKVIKLKYLDNFIDLELERIHNRFRTEEEARQAAEAVRETLEKFYEQHAGQ